MAKGPERQKSAPMCGKWVWKGEGLQWPGMASTPKLREMVERGHTQLPTLSNLGEEGCKGQNSRFEMGWHPGSLAPFFYSAVGACQDNPEHGLPCPDS